MGIETVRRWSGVLGICVLLWGCAMQQVQIPDEYASAPRREMEEEGPSPKDRGRPKKGVSTPGVTTRVITESEISKVCEKNPDLTPSKCLEILARLNTRARYYIPGDIKNRKPMKVPADFMAYRNWTPMPRDIPRLREVQRFILIVKNIPFLGWYEKGRLAGDTQICIGKMPSWTKTGIYKVLDKDIDHVSQSYPNAYGQPSPMPFALRIYDRVWIHAGDVVGGYCSHGCINLPLEPAVKVFHWADKNTFVLIVESLNDLPNNLDRHSKILLPGRR